MREADSELVAGAIGCGRPTTEPRSALGKPGDGEGRPGGRSPDRSFEEGSCSGASAPCVRPRGGRSAPWPRSEVSRPSPQRCGLDSGKMRSFREEMPRSQCSSSILWKVRHAANRETGRGRRIVVDPAVVTPLRSEVRPRKGTDDERHEGSGPGDRVRLLTRGNLWRVMRRRETPVWPMLLRKPRQAVGKHGEPQVRHRAATRSEPAVSEEPVEVVRNHVDGTRSRGGTTARTISARTRRGRGVDARRYVGGGDQRKIPGKEGFAERRIRHGSGSAGSEVNVWRRSIELETARSGA